MPRGPAPTPTHLKLVRGNPGKRRLNESEPIPSHGVPECPAFLGELGRTEWGRIVVELEGMGILHSSDMAVLAMYCEAWEEFQECLAEMRSVGRVAESHTGATYQHPIVGMKNKAAERVLKLADRFGLSPSARTRIQVAEQKEEDPLDALLAKRNNA